MKKNILSLFISCVVILFMIVFIISPKKSFSELEFRYLEKLPSFSFNNLINGKYISNIESYINDHFPLRSYFMFIKSKYQRLLGFDLINNTYVGKDDYLFSKYEDSKNTDKLIDVLNKFYNKNNYNVNAMFIPSSGVINSDKLPSYVDFNKQLETINYIKNNLDFNFIDVTDNLIEGNKKYDMFYRLDHHYTMYGAYYTYLKYCEVNNIKPLLIDEFDIKTVTNDFNGTLYSKVNLYDLKSDSIDVFNYNNNLTLKYNDNKIYNSLYFNDHLNTKDKYSYFLNGNFPLIEITNNDIDNNKELVIVKDSYANCFIPFIVNHYKKIHVIDLRFYNGSVSEYMNNNNLNNIIFLYNINDIDSDIGIYNLK